ncbi:MAG TPA: class I SAM-dependent methyltransferase [Solirubrobacteraceae bacterium]|jgi:SAM-dependent methyltransferase
MTQTTTFYQLSDEQITELTAYVIHRERALDRDLLPYGDPRGKDVLVFGCGYGNEVLWAARHGARSVLAIDLTAGLSPVPFERALDECGLEYSNYEFRRENVHDTALTGQTFDLIVSNGVFEHILDLKGVLGAFRPLLNPGGRVAIFADALWYSSLGGHIGKGPWEHLWRAPEELKREIAPKRWQVFCNQLNRMTSTDFIAAVRSTGMLIMQLRLGRDPNIAQLPELLPLIRERCSASVADLSVVSLGCELCFEENL